MRIFVSVLGGESPASARPIFSSSDPEIIEATVDAILARVGARRRGKVEASAEGNPDDWEDGR